MYTIKTGIRDPAAPWLPAGFAVSISVSIETSTVTKPLDLDTILAEVSEKR
jgi:hypothetical protein